MTLALYFCNDPNMNVTALASTSGAAVERYVYDPYGKVTILDGTTGGQTEWAADADQKSHVDNEILFGGYRYDTETGLYLLRRRYYHATLGRLINRDPLEYADGLNLYNYTGNKPIVATDPMGGCSSPGYVSGHPICDQDDFYQERPPATTVKARLTREPTQQCIQEGDKGKTDSVEYELDVQETSYDGISTWTMAGHATVVCGCCEWPPPEIGWKFQKGNLSIDRGSEKMEKFPGEPTPESERPSRRPPTEDEVIDGAFDRAHKWAAKPSPGVVGNMVKNMGDAVFWSGEEEYRKNRLQGIKRDE